MMRRSWVASVVALIVLACPSTKARCEDRREGKNGIAVTRRHRTHQQIDNFHAAGNPAPRGADLLLAAPMPPRTEALSQSVATFLEQISRTESEARPPVEWSWWPWLLTLGIALPLAEWGRRRIFRVRPRLNLTLDKDWDSLSWVPGLPGLLTEEAGSK
jgi:hypothetical protein